MDPQRRSVVVFSPFNAYPGVPHAGGEYLLRHLEVLSETFTVTLLTPDPAPDPRPGDRDLPWESIVLSQAPTRLMNLLEKFRKGILGGALPWSFSRAVISDRRARERVRSADIIEYQWTEAASVERAVRRLNPTARRRLFMLDVLSQRWLRSARTSRAVKRRGVATVRLATAWLGEAARLRAVSGVGVLSQKDKDVLLRCHPRCPPVSIVSPWLVDAEMPTQPMPHGVSERVEVLFTGALGRPENEEAVLWLLRDVWPHLDANVDIHLTLAGAGPSERLLAALPSFGVTVTGYVPSLAPLYAASDVFVAPLLSGAGVKFKVITGMLWGLPIVATPVAAEGIGTREQYVTVTDDPRGFAEALSRIADDPERRRRIGAENLAWARTTYGRDQFRDA